MEFLKSILGDELFSQVEEKVNAYNGENKDNQVKIGNLASGEYVGKGKFDSLEQNLNGKLSELENANKLIAELKKGTKDSEGLQSKIAQYESDIERLQKQMAENKLKSAIKVSLLSEKATDIDYLTYKLEHKLKEEGKSLELDENDNIKGWNELCKELKTQFPTQFDGAMRKVDPQKLDDGIGNDTITQEQFSKMGYLERLKLFNENPEEYQKFERK